VTIKDTGAWGGEPEILALSRAYKVPIHVVQGGVSRIVEHNPGPSPRLFARVARISYHRRMYGLGEVCILYRERYILSTLSSIIILCGQEAPCHKWLARSSRRSLNAYTRIHSYIYVRNNQPIFVLVSMQICENINGMHAIRIVNRPDHHCGPRQVVAHPSCNHQTHHPTQRMDLQF
jgi:hypothetical protein